jgi:hypothetical protein
MAALISLSSDPFHEALLSPWEPFEAAIFSLYLFFFVHRQEAKAISCILAIGEKPFFGKV